MGVAERLRQLDNAVVGPPPSRPEQAPIWARLATAGMGTWFLLLIWLDEYRTVGWLVAASVYGAIEVPAFVATVRWHHRRGTMRSRLGLTAFAGFPFAVGGAIIIAVIVAPAPWSRSHYARGCHPASRSVYTKIIRTIRGDFHVERIVVVRSKDAAVASALVTGTLDVGGLTVSLVRQPADYALAPGPLTANNDLARRLSPSLQALFVSGPIGSASDQVNNDRVAAETCVLSPG